MFGALKRGFRSMASLILVRNVVGELQPKRTLAASRGFLAAARLSCCVGRCKHDGVVKVKGCTTTVLVESECAGCCRRHGVCLEP